MDHGWNKFHACLGSYNKTAEHAGQQGKGAEESSMAAAQGSKARQQGKGAGHGANCDVRERDDEILTRS